MEAERDEELNWLDDYDTGDGQDLESEQDGDRLELEGVEVQSTDGSRPPLQVKAAAITTAAAMVEKSGKQAAKKERPRVSPEDFVQGMAVVHPEYGPGKIVALSGRGKNRAGQQSALPPPTKSGSCSATAR